jgi:hypothetical protein
VSSRNSSGSAIRGQGGEHNQMTYSGFPMYVTQCRYQHGMYICTYVLGNVHRGGIRLPFPWDAKYAEHTGGPPYRMIKCSCETATQIRYTTRPLRPTPGALPEGRSYIMEAAPEITPLRPYGKSKTSLPFLGQNRKGEGGGGERGGGGHSIPQKYVLLGI